MTTTPVPQAANSSPAPVASTLSNALTHLENTIDGVPIVLGVTGHRDLRSQDVPALAIEVRRIFDDLNAQYPHTPFVLLSALDEGADRLVARVALDVGAYLVPVLPWPRGVWDEGLCRSGSREEFEGLLGRSLGAIALPLPEGTAVKEVGQSEALRQQQFDRVGAYIARHGQILIALWDGVLDVDGGTVRTIRSHEWGVAADDAEAQGPLDEVERGPIFHIAAPRREHPSPCVKVERLPYPRAQNSSEDRMLEVQRGALQRTWKRLDQFNQDAAKRSESFQAMLDTSRDWVIPLDEQTSLPEHLKYLFEQYSRADAASLAYQKQGQRTFNWLYVLILLAVICLEVHAHLLRDSWYLLLVYGGFLGLALVLLLVARRRELQVRHLDYRALAEAVRVQFFWRMAGLRDFVADYYLRTFRSELDWIRQAVRSCNLVAGALGPSCDAAGDKGAGGAEKSHDSRMGQVFVRWVEDQAKYFDKKAPENEKLHRQFEAAAAVFFVLALVAGAADLFSHQEFVRLALGIRPEQGHEVHDMLIVVVFLCLALAAILHQYAERSAYKILAHKYEWMHFLYETARQRLAGMLERGDHAAACDLVRELGAEALTENADWVIQRRNRPPQLPHA